nr:hypothetical protein [Bacteroidota bacterium]
MEKLTVGQVIKLCQNGNDDNGKEILIEMLQSGSIGLILSKTRVSEKHDALSIFYDAIMDQLDEILSGKFVFVDEVKFRAYFRKKCIFKANAFVRENIAPFIPMADISEQTEHLLENEYDEIRNEGYYRKNELYNLDLSPDPQKPGFPKQVMEAFHQLSDKCKMLIILKKLMNVSHRKIVDTVGLLYTIGNENVSKNMLKRCWKNLVALAT